MIEEAIAERSVQVVAATTTLAEGVDLPFRFSILADWLTWDGGKQVPMKPLLFRNIAGRCGRAGVFTEGDTLVFDNPLGNLQYTASGRRFAAQSLTFLQDEARQLNSALEAAPEVSDQNALQAAMASQFLAAIPENPDVEDLVTTFSEQTLAGAQSARGSRALRSALSSARDTVLHHHQPFAVAASPMRLTALGEAANRTGLSPDSCIRLMDALEAGEQLSTLEEWAHFLLIRLAFIPEQSNSSLRRIGTPRSRFCVKESDLEHLVSLWVHGETEEAMFRQLPFVRRSKRRPSADDWLSGIHGEPSTWDDEFDGFIDLVSGAFSTFLPWVIRAAAHLSNALPTPSPQPDWWDWADSLEFGLPNRWAVSVQRRGAPGTRLIKATVAVQWPFSPSMDDPLALWPLRTLQGMGAIRSLYETLLAESEGTPEGREIQALFDWISTEVNVDI